MEQAFSSLRNEKPGEVCQLKKYSKLIDWGQHHIVDYGVYFILAKFNALSHDPVAGGGQFSLSLITGRERMILDCLSGVGAVEYNPEIIYLRFWCDY